MSQVQGWPLFSGLPDPQKWQHKSYFPIFPFLILLLCWLYFVRTTELIGHCKTGPTFKDQSLFSNARWSILSRRLDASIANVMQIKTARTALLEIYFKTDNVWQGHDRLIPMYNGPKAYGSVPRCIRFVPLVSDDLIIPLGERSKYVAQCRTRQANTHAQWSKSLRTYADMYMRLYLLSTMTLLYSLAWDQVVAISVRFTSLGEREQPCNLCEMTCWRQLNGSYSGWNPTTEITNDNSIIRKEREI